MVKGTQVSIEFDLNKYSILAALLIDCKNFCGDRSHLWHFLRLTWAEDGIRLQVFAAARHRADESERSEHSKAIRNAEIPLSALFS